MKIRPCVLAVALSSLIFIPSLASANSFTCTTICTVALTNTNISNLSGNVAVEVTIDNTGPKTKLIVQWLTNGTPFTPLGIDEFSYNSSVKLSTIGNNTTIWNLNFDGSNVDGFGNFASHKDLGGGNEQGGLFSPGHPLVFTLNGKVTTWNRNDHGSLFVVHFRFANGCSGFISDGTSTGIEADSSCTFSLPPPSNVPEPSTVMLIGAGVLGSLRLRKKMA